jgi:hypothetical protein
MMLKGSNKEDVESVHIKIVDIKRENYSVTKDQRKTVTCGNIFLTFPFSTFSIRTSAVG